MVNEETIVLDVGDCAEVCVGLVVVEVEPGDIGRNVEFSKQEINLNIAKESLFKPSDCALVELLLPKIQLVLSNNDLNVRNGVCRYVFVVNR